MSDRSRKKPPTDNRTPQVFLSAFGKHPGWGDHMDDIGLETEELVELKRILYMQGIRGNVDAGAWESIDPLQRLNGFKHLFVWKHGSELVVGRMWSSRDSKGRAQYPMIVCAHCVGLPLRWSVQNVFPQLEAIETRCIQTTSAEDVTSIIDEGRRELRRLVERSKPSPSAIDPFPYAISRLADRPEIGPGHQGIHRILYQIDREMAAYKTGRNGGGAAEGQARQIRVPACFESPVDSASCWIEFIGGLIDSSIPLLVFLPIGESWLDILVGWPGQQQLYCMRASNKAIPLTSDVPYDLDGEFVQRVERKIEDARYGSAEAKGAKSKAAKPAAAAEGTHGKSSAVPRANRGAVGVFRRSLLLQILLLIVALIVLILVLVLVMGHESRRVLSSVLPEEGTGATAGQSASMPIRSALGETVWLDRDGGGAPGACNRGGRSCDRPRRLPDRGSALAHQARRAASAWNLLLRSPRRHLHCPCRAEPLRRPG